MGIEGSIGRQLGRRLRLGMVGGGQGAFIGGVHRIAARLDDHYELVAGALSSDPQRAADSARELGLAADRSYASYTEMAQRESERPDGIDVVSVVTPNYMHYPVASVFLNHGIDVICDKPITTTLQDAESLASLVEQNNRVFCLTHNYTGYPMVRQARAMVADGDLGKIRVVQVEYPQDWLSTKLEDTGHKQAEWRTDPQRSGAGGCIGDIGTHAYNLAAFITGLKLESLAAELTTFVEGRALDDHVQILLRYEGGARGILWTSQVTPGNENALRIRVYGEKAGLEWAQEDPNFIVYSALGETPRRITRGGNGSNEVAAAVTRIPPGHPEGYLEGFANLYRDVAEVLVARLENRQPDPLCCSFPTVSDGVDGMRFINAAVESSQRDSAWVRL
jgi:predicted dehydrogenase